MPIHRKTPHTFRPLFFPPPPRRSPRCDLKPLTSSSRTMEGGLTFLPHPWVCGWLACAGSSFLAGSTRAGGAKTTAVLEITAGDDIVAVDACAWAMAAPTGRRAAVGFGFGGGFRRTGAKARLADHPGRGEVCQVHHRTLRDSMDDGFVNKRALQRQGCIEGEIPAVAFTEALPSVAAFALEVASDATGVGCAWLLEGVVDGAAI